MIKVFFDLNRFKQPERGNFLLLLLGFLFCHNRVGLLHTTFTYLGIHPGDQHINIFSPFAAKRTFPGFLGHLNVFFVGQI